jgi:hypothetical protein
MMPGTRTTATDSRDALIAIASGQTAAVMAARAADPSAYDAYRTTEGMRDLVGGELGHLLPALLVPGDDLAAEMAAGDALLAASMAELEAGGCTRETARAVIRRPACPVDSRSYRMTPPEVTPLPQSPGVPAPAVTP